MTIEPIQGPRSDPAPDADAGGAARRLTLLLLAREGDPWGLAATRAATAAGLRVRRHASAADLVHTLETEATRTAAVLLLTRALPAECRREWADRLGDRTGDRGLPLFVLAGDGVDDADDPPLTDGHSALTHVTVLQAPPTERVLTTVLRAARREMERRDHVCHLLRRLEEAGRREERLLARVGHELRNPLGAITSALTLLREVTAEETSPACRYRRLIERQVDTLTRAVDEMLNVAGQRVIRLTADGGRSNGGAGGDLPSANHNRGRSGENGALTVLLVEDDADGRQALSELLRMWGHEVREAADGEAAMEAVKRRPPQVALVDIGLPGIDGYEVARRIRRDHPQPPPLLIAMTGFGQPEDRRRAVEAGFDLHLVKPIRPARLAELLREQEGG